METFNGKEESVKPARGIIVRSQIRLWEQLLGARIRFQRVVSLVNQLPQNEQDWPTQVDDCRSTLKTTLDKLVRIKEELAERNKTNEDGTSSTDEDDQSDPIETKGPGRKRRINQLDDYAQCLAQSHQQSRTFRNGTIKEWFEKTRLASGKFTRSSFTLLEKDPLQQIEQILSDGNRLVKRTQLKRTRYTVLGKDNQDDEYDQEIFDDDDFYQQLLRELIERRTATVTDPVALSRHWLELQKLRSKSRKTGVDRRASKGRRCRFDTIPKLVNYMAPIDHCAMTDKAREELFASLFKSTY